MTFEFNCTGSDRKKLVTAISALAEMDAKYMGAPTFAYQVGPYNIDKNGTIIVSEGVAPSDVDYLLERLYEQGFTAQTDDTEEAEGISIQIPMASFTNATLQNLFDLIDAKGSLIRNALGVTDLPVNLMDDRLDFPWFPADSTSEEVKAYMDFITALCNMARTQKRITAKEKAVDNEKYAFRCFLLRLGFIGAEHKQARKILLRNLTGSSAFKAGTKKAANNAMAEALADERLLLEINGVVGIEGALEEERFLQELNASFSEEAAV